MESQNLKEQELKEVINDNKNLIADNKNLREKQNDLIREIENIINTSVVKDTNLKYSCDDNNRDYPFTKTGIHRSIEEEHHNLLYGEQPYMLHRKKICTNYSMALTTFRCLLLSKEEMLSAKEELIKSLTKYKLNCLKIEGDIMGYIQLSKNDTEIGNLEELFQTVANCINE